MGIVEYREQLYDFLLGRSGIILEIRNDPDDVGDPYIV
jgi:hypothetical protein